MTTPAVPVFDGHNDTILKLEIRSRRGKPNDFTGPLANLDIDLPRARKGGLAGGLFAMYVPSRLDDLAATYDVNDPRNTKPVPQPAALDFTLALFARMSRIARRLPDDVALCTGPSAVRAAMTNGRIAVVPHVEGAEAIDTDLTVLEVFYRAGLRSLGPVWSRSNPFGHGAPMDAQPQIEPGEGLTDPGRALVRGCNELGIMIDCSHLTERGFWDVAEVSDRPLVATHSNVHAICPSARNLTDRQLDAIAERGGLVGLNFHVGFLREDCRADRDTPILTMIRHLDHLLERLGETGVALGSDFDGCLLPREIGDVTGLPRLVAAMRQAGYGDALISKICSENWLSQLEYHMAD